MPPDPSPSVASARSVRRLPILSRQLTLSLAVATIALDEDPFEPDNVPVARLCAELQRRTNLVAGRGDQVSPVPIVLRVEYAHCANLTIYDTPGFRLGGDEKLKNEIHNMVRNIMVRASADAHR